ncbi:MAG TPA: hypothetical protein VF691_08710, partial [Cytophagaceae bacterium]
MDDSAIIPRDDTGRVYLKENLLIWELSGSSLLEIDRSKIRLIGEYTTMHAVFRNDWFIVFLASGDEPLQVSAYANGMSEVLKELSVLLNANLNPKLTQATDFKSNVIWPAGLTGNALYELKIIESKSWFDRFRARLGFG